MSISPTLLARQDDHRIGTAIAQAGERPGDHQHEIGVGLHVEERAQRSTDPPRTGIGIGFMPEARRKRTGGLSMTRQPVASISTARHALSPRSR